MGTWDLSASGDDFSEIDGANAAKLVPCWTSRAGPCLLGRAHHYCSVGDSSQELAFGDQCELRQCRPSHQGTVAGFPSSTLPGDDIRHQSETSTSKTRDGGLCLFAVWGRLWLAVPGLHSLEFIFAMIIGLSPPCPAKFATTHTRPLHHSPVAFDASHDILTRLLSTGIHHGSARDPAVRQEAFLPSHL